MTVPSTYCIDASSLIHGHVEAYPLSSFPSLWNKIEGLVAAGRMCAPQEICGEVNKRSNSASQWVKTQKTLCVPPSQVQTVEVQRIIRLHPRLLNIARGKSGGDPWLIALANLNGHTIVTEEKNKGDINNPRIPDVAAALGIQCISLRQLIVAEQWRF